MHAFANGRVLTERGIEEGLAVLINRDRIVDVLPESDARVAAAERYDLNGRTLLPGFIDSQVNGGGDVLFNDAPTVSTIRRIAEAHRRYGTTGLLPTLITDNPDKTRCAIAAVDEAIAEGVPGVLGIHLEGPFLSPDRPGVHDRHKIRAIDRADIAAIGTLRNGCTVLTVAPERVPVAVVRELTDRGIIVVAGHTAGTYEEICAGLDAGIRGFTHLFNAMTPLQAREPGAVGAALEEEASWCGLIVDGHHVHPATLRIALRSKARRKLMLVTDAMPPVGGTLPSFQLGDDQVTCDDGACRTSAGKLAGSCLNMATAVSNTVGLLGVPLDEAARMAATYPAEFLRIQQSHGRIAAGCAADFALMNDSLQVCETWIAGRCYTAK